jgi:hypothetical protein
MNALFRDGAAGAGYHGEIAAYPGELVALRALVAGARRGDVVAVMSHVERADIFAWLAEAGFAPVGMDRLRQLVAGD